MKGVWEGGDGIFDRRGDTKERRNKEKEKLFI